MIKIYFAPMEGITGYIFRNAYHKYFGQIDKFFTPFIAPDQNKCFHPRELQDILPEHNEGLYVVPQILTNRAEHFIKTAKELQNMGYQEVNLNLGCPSKTVVTKHRGSGFLAEPDMLDAFLEQVFSNTDMKISIKTRIGVTSPDEFNELNEIFNKYPLEELIIHPRIQTDYYKNKPNLIVFEYAVNNSRHSLCYNGDLFSQEDCTNFQNQFPKIDIWMMGRGLLSNPFLAGQLKTNDKVDVKTLKAFHDDVYNGYREVMSGDRNVLFKMKELWFYLIHSFEDAGKYGKKIKKSEKLIDYEQAVKAIFECGMI